MACTSHLLLLHLLLLVVVGGTAPNSYRWYVEYDDGGKTCVTMQATIQLTINYTTTWAGHQLTTINLINATHANGSCNADGKSIGDSQLENLWTYFIPQLESDGTEVVGDDPWRLQMEFGCCNESLYGAENRYALVGVSVHYKLDKEHFPNITDDMVGDRVAERHGGMWFPAYVNAGYACFTPTDIHIDDVVTITVQQVEYQSFKNRAKSEDSRNMDVPAYACPADNIEDDALYVKVGIALLSQFLALASIFIVLNIRYSRRQGHTKLVYTIDGTDNKAFQDGGQK